jgi:hypothetical protein
LSKFTVVYDACVLYPAPLRDLLTQLATAVPPLFRAKWTDEIHEEWVGNVLKDRNDLTREQLARTTRLMNESVPDCLVEGYEHLLESVELPDPDDRHVVAAAIHARADAIVTLNLKDFPPDALENMALKPFTQTTSLRTKLIWTRLKSSSQRKGAEAASRTPANQLINTSRRCRRNHSPRL